MVNMKNSFRFALLATSLVLGSNHAAAAGDIAAGKTKSALCQSCHGATGNETLNGTYPRLAGQYENYLVHVLKAYRSGERKNPVMAGFAAGLSDQDIDNLAAFFSSQDGQLSILPKDGQ